MATTFDDETLMAYVDAELDASTARLVEQEVKINPDVAAKVEAFRGSAAIAKRAFAAELEEPVPDSLLKSVNAAIERERVHARDAAQTRPSATARQPTNALPKTWFSWLMQPSFALAASVAAFTFTFAGYLLGTFGTQDQGSERGHNERICGDGERAGTNPFSSSTERPPLRPTTQYG